MFKLGAAVVLSLSLVTVEGFNLCLLFNTCNKNDDDRSRSSSSNSNPGEEPIRVQGGRWIKSSTLHNGQIYLFADDLSTATNWWEAQKYCNERGSYLAEPADGEESQFLRNQAFRQRPEANWWLGLRGVERCKCSPSSFGRSFAAPAGVSFDGSLDSFTIWDTTSRDGMVRTICPPGYSKICENGRDWRWSTSGGRISFGDWNDESGEPNDQNENCVTMWRSGRDYRWADFRCHSLQEPGRQFRPVCQKGEYDVEEETEKEEADDDANDGLTQFECVDKHVLYKPVKSAILRKMDGVSRFEDCQRYCDENVDCVHWIWKGLGNKNKRCVLTSDVRSPEFTRAKQGAASGTKLPGCGDSNGGETRGRWCVDHDALYEDGDEIGYLDDVASGSECRSACIGTPDCQLYSWFDRDCSLMSNRPGSRNWTSVYVRGATSGTVDGVCLNQNLDRLGFCECLQLQLQDYYHYDYEESSLVESGLIDVKSRSRGGDDTRCPDNQGRRCFARISAGSGSAAIIPRINF